MHLACCWVEKICHERELKLAWYKNLILLGVSNIDVAY